ncbi:MAG: tRNA guanosine(15) transglycosylase TgtA [Halobacteriaceae archaeon]
MPEVFEVRAQDGAGRVGDLRVPRADATVRTPALLPVVNPNLQTVDPARFEAFGAQALITNAYIVHGTTDLRERALTEGLHEMLGFDGPVMTDSGSFQLAEYGEIDVTTAEILRFQREAGADIGTPVDVPTPPDADRETAERDLQETAARLDTAAGVDTGDMLVTAPVQGSTHLDLRERAAREAYATDLDVFPVGAVVPLLEDYRFDDVVDVVAAAKRGLGADAPVHLFGAGHPMTFALAAAAGCDLFDSAAYALYARDGRYLTPRGTRHVADLHEFPCSCPVCTGHDPADLTGADGEERERLLSEHNLHVSFAEMRRVRQAVRTGRLFELLEARARGHPRLLDGYRALLEYGDWLASRDPASKDAFFYLSAESARRPEVVRHHERLDRLAVDADALALVVEGAPVDRDALDAGAVWPVVPPFGPVPPALAETYPVGGEVPRRTDDDARGAAARGVARIARAHPSVSLTLYHDGWPAPALDALPARVARERVGDGA